MRLKLFKLGKFFLKAKIKQILKNNKKDFE